MKIVTSRENAAFKAMAKLSSSTSERKKSGLSVLEGAHLVAAYLDSGRAVESLVASRTGLESPEIAALVGRVPDSRVVVVTDALFDHVSSVESATGIVASVPTPQGEPVPPDADLVVLVEDVQDPGNLGTLLRSAAAAGARHVMLSKHCVFAWSQKTVRAAMGAHFALNIAEGADLPAYLAAYRGTSVALAGEAERSIYEAGLRGPLAVVVGNEGAGVSPELRAAVTMTARIPMPGRMESLNAGVAGSIVLFEALRQRSRP